MSDYPTNATPNPPAPISSDLRVYVDAAGDVWGRDYATGIGYLLSSPPSSMGPQGPKGDQGEPGNPGAEGPPGPNPIITAADQAAIKALPPQHQIFAQSDADGTMYFTSNNAWVQINTTPIP